MRNRGKKVRPPVEVVVSPEEGERQEEKDARNTQDHLLIPPTKDQGETVSVERVDGLKVNWHSHFSLVPPGPAIFLGQEFLDALPVRVAAIGWEF